MRIHYPMRKRSNFNFSVDWAHQLGICGVDIWSMRVRICRGVQGDNRECKPAWNVVRRILPVVSSEILDPCCAAVPPLRPAAKMGDKEGFKKKRYKTTVLITDVPKGNKPSPVRMR